MSRKLELMSAFLDAYGATRTRSQVDVFLRALLRNNHDDDDGVHSGPERPS